MQTVQGRSSRRRSSPCEARHSGQHRPGHGPRLPEGMGAVILPILHVATTNLLSVPQLVSGEPRCESSLCLGSSRRQGRPLGPCGRRPHPPGRQQPRPCKAFPGPRLSQGAENPFPQRRTVAGLVGGPRWPATESCIWQRPEILRASSSACKHTGRLAPMKLG